MKNNLALSVTIVLLFTLPFGLWAKKNNNNSSFQAKIGTTYNLQCNLPAPSGLNVTGTTASTVTIQWSPVPGAIGYQVEAEVNGVPFTVLSTIGPMATIVGLPSDVDVDIWVSAICSSNEVSSESAYIVARTGIIIEIVYKGLEVSCDQTTFFATFSSKLSTNVVFLDNITYKGIFQHKSIPGQFMEFYFKASNITEPVLFTEGALNIPGHHLRGLDANYNCIGQMVPAAYITNCNAFLNPLAQITVKHNNNLEKVFQVSNLSPSYSLTIYTCLSDSKDTKGEERVSDYESAGFAQEITVAPNPFTNTINIQYPDNSDILRVKLYDLGGKLCFEKEYHTPIGGGAVECVTTNLTDGIYFLNATTGNTTQTFKLVKQN